MVKGNTSSSSESSLHTDDSDAGDDSIFQKAKDYDHTQEYKHDLYVDAKDSVGKWCVGQIVELDEDKNIARVHYDGWPLKYDEMIPLTSNKIAPFRYFTTWYTGQVGSAYRDFHFNFVLNEKFKKELKDILENGFEILETPRKVTQYIRGDLYFYVDSMLSLFLNTTVDELPMIYEFMGYVFKVIQLWLRVFQKTLFKNYKYSLKHKKLYMVDFDTALAKSGFELIDILSKSFGKWPRCLDLYKHFGNVRFYQGVEEVVPFKLTDNYGLMVSLMNSFAELRGIDSIRSFILWNNYGLKNSVIPIVYLNNLLKAMERFILVSSSEFRKELEEMFKNAVKIRIENVTEKEILEVNTNFILDLLYTLRNILRSWDHKIIEQLELMMVKKLINWNKLENKIKGIVELCRIQKTVSKSTIFDDLRKDDFGQRKAKTDWLTHEYFVGWVIKNEILETIFMDSAHPELIRRSFDFVHMLATLGKIDQKYIEILWNNVRGTHEETARATLDLLLKIVINLNLNWVSFIFKKVNEVPNTEYDEIMMQFLREYTQKAMIMYDNRESEGSGNIFQDAYKWLQQKKTKNDRIKYFNLDKFWDIANDELVTKSNIKQMAKESLIQLLKHFSWPLDLKVHYLNLSIERLLESENLIDQLKTFKSIASNFSMFDTKEYEAFHKTNDMFGGLKILIIQKLESIVSNMATQIQLSIIDDNLKQGKDIANTHKMINEHKMLYIDSLDLIDFIVMNAKIFLTNQEIDALFRIYVNNNKFSEHGQDILYEFFMKKGLAGRSILTHKNKRYLFESILCSLNKIDHSRLTLKGFHCFLYLFLKFNMEEEFLIYDKQAVSKLFNFEGSSSNFMKNIGNFIIEARSFAMLGHESIWRIISSTQYEDVLYQCEVFLTSLYLKLNTPHPSDQLIFETFFEKAIMLLNLKETTTSNLLHLLTTFFKIDTEIHEYRRYLFRQKELPKKDSSKSSVQKDYEDTTEASQEEISTREPERTEEPEIFFSTFRNIEASKVFVSSLRYLNSIINLLVYPDYETVGQAIKLIEKLPVISHEQGEIFLKFFYSQTQSEEEKNEFVNYFGNALDSPQHTFYWLHFLEKGWKNSWYNRSKNLWAFEPFNLWMIIDYLKLLSEIKAEESHKVPLLANIWSKLIETTLETFKDEILLEMTVSISKYKYQRNDLFDVPKVETLDFENDQDLKIQLKDAEDIFGCPIDKRQRFVAIGGKEILVSFTEEVLNNLWNAVINLFNIFSKNNDGYDQKEINKQEKISNSFLKKGTSFPTLLIPNALEGCINHFFKEAIRFFQHSLWQYDRLFFLTRLSNQYQKLDIFFITLIISGQKIDWKRMLNSFFEFLCRGAEYRAKTNNNISDSLFYFVNLMLANILEPLFSNQNSSPGDVSEQFFKILFELIGTSWSVSFKNNHLITDICTELSIDIRIFKSNANYAWKMVGEEEYSELKRDMRKIFAELNNRQVKLNDALDQALDNIFQNVTPDEFFEKLLEMMYSKSNQIEETADPALEGIIQFIEIILIKYPTLMSETKRVKLLDYFLNKCLFKIEDGVLLDKALYKNRRLREGTMSTWMSMLYQKFPLENDVLISFTYQLLWNMRWRNLTRKSWYWNYNHQLLDSSSNVRRKNPRRGIDKKNRSKFVGLNNLRNTWYMNSIFQQLFMIPCFRASVMKADNPNKNTVIYQSKLMIAALLKLDKPSFTPRDFFSSLTDESGHPFNPSEQRDADEFFVRYWNLLEEGLKGTKESKLIKTLFEGKYANQLICIDCPHRSERDEAFVTLSLQVKNKKTIKESLAAFVESEILQGDNAYSCEQCSTKVTCMKRTWIKQLPNVLVSVLKRFELNYDTMSHIKLNGKLEFSKELNMKEYTVEYIEKQTLLKEMEDKNLAKADLTYAKRAILERELPSDYYQYHLKGVVIHMGEANAGHYYSYIADRDCFNTNQWYEFNDSEVHPFDVEELDERAYGGEGEIYYTDENGKQNYAITERSNSAYMLIYERKQMYVWEMKGEKEELFIADEFGNKISAVKASLLQEIEEEKLIPIEELEESDIEVFMRNKDKLNSQSAASARKDSMLYEVHIPQEFRDLIQNINMKEWQLKYIFCPNLVESIWNYLFQIEIIKFEDYEACKDLNLQQDLRAQPAVIDNLGIDLVQNIELIKFGIKYFLTVVLRTTSGRSQYSAPMYNFITTSIANNIAIALFTIELFTYPHIITEMLMTVPLITFETAIAGIVTNSLIKLYPYEHLHIQNYLRSTSTQSISDYLSPNKQWKSQNCNSNSPNPDNETVQVSNKNINNLYS